MTIDILKNKEVLTSEEANTVREVDSEWADKYLFKQWWNNTYLNLEVYSEVDKEQLDYRKEIGY